MSQGLVMVGPDRRVRVMNRRAAEILALPPHLAQPGVPFGDLVAFHKGCRAMQRAKLAAWHLDEPDCRDPDRWRGRAHDYLELAAINAEQLL